MKFPSQAPSLLPPSHSRQLITQKRKKKKKRILFQWQKIQIISFGQGNDISKAPLIARKLCCIERHLPKDIAACVTPLPWRLVALRAPKIWSSGFPKAQADRLGKEGNKASGKEKKI